MMKWGNLYGTHPDGMEILKVDLIFIGNVKNKICVKLSMTGWNVSEQNTKRSKNDMRREHTERRSGEKHKHRVQQEKINEADKAIKDFCTTMEEHPLADE